VRKQDPVATSEAPKRTASAGRAIAGMVQG
jgi:hypothetical protein